MFRLQRNIDHNLKKIYIQKTTFPCMEIIPRTATQVMLRSFYNAGRYRIIMYVIRFLEDKLCTI
jgi:hypothetical protein